MTDLGTFEATWRLLDDVEGWLTRGQAQRLHDAASSLTAPATIVEIGSFRGRSAIVLGRAAPEGVRIYAIDPHAGTDRGPREFETSAATGDADHDAFDANLRRAGVRDRIEHVRAFSDRAHDAVDGDIDVLFIDGAHRFAPARDDIRDWGDRVVAGGVMLIHDSFNSVGVTLAQAATLVFGSGWTYEGRSGSLTQYRKAPVDGVQRLKNTGSQLAELGYFAKSVAIKAALTANRPELARKLGHHQDAPWPY